MNSIRKCLLHGTLAAMLSGTAQPGAAEQYTAGELELRTGWRLEFKEGFLLSFHTASEALELRWTGDAAGHPWLVKSQRVSVGTLEEQDTTAFDRYSREQLQVARQKWQQAKQRHEEQEDQRLKEKKAAHDLKVEGIRRQYAEELAEWQRQKAEFDKEAKEEYQEEWEEWEEADQERHEELGEYLTAMEEYEREGAELLSPSTWFGAPDLPEDERPPKPLLKEFPTPKPLEPRIADYTPSPTRFFEEPEPQLDAPPAYQVTNLALYLALNRCPSERFRLKTGKQIQFVDSRPQFTQGPSPWGASVELLQCEVTSKSGEPLLSLRADQDRLVSLQLWKPSLRLELQRIVSPALVAFKQELGKREMYLKTLEFRREPVRASYWEARERTQLDLSYTATDQAVQLRATLPVQFYDSSEKNKRNVVSRVDGFRELALGGQSRLLLRQLATHPPGKSSQWQLKATIHYAVVEGEVANLIKVQNRGGGRLEKLEIGSDGMVYDFSGLWYLVSWVNRKGASELPLIYFNDTRVFVMRLVRGGEEAVRFEGRDIPVTVWTLHNVEGAATFRFQVGKRDHIVYEFHAPGTNRTLRLKQIGTKTIRKNQAWADDYRKKHRLSLLSAEAP